MQNVNVITDDMFNYLTHASILYYLHVYETKQHKLTFTNTAQNIKLKSYSVLQYILFTTIRQ